MLGEKMVSLADTGPNISQSLQRGRRKNFLQVISRSLLQSAFMASTVCHILL